MKRKEQKKAQRVRITIVARFEFAAHELLELGSDLCDVKDRIREHGEIITEELEIIP